MSNPPHDELSASELPSDKLMPGKLPDGSSSPSEDSIVGDGAVGNLPVQTHPTDLGNHQRPGKRAQQTVRELSWQLRVLSLACGLGVIVLLGTAATLRPNAQGLGTHQQLGFPPCSFLLAWGIPCPSCGMTTSWAHLMHGQLLASVTANVAGAMLAIIALAYVPISCYFFISGKSSRGGWFATGMAVALLVAMAVAVTQWLVRLFG